MLLALYVMEKNKRVNSTPIHEAPNSTHIPDKGDFYDVRINEKGDGIRFIVRAVIFDSNKIRGEQTVNLICEKICDFKVGEQAVVLS